MPDDQRRSDVSINTEWASAPDTIFYDVPMPVGRIGLVMDGGGGEAFCLYGTPGEIMEALERAINVLHASAAPSWELAVRHKSGTIETESSMSGSAKAMVAQYTRAGVPVELVRRRTSIIVVTPPGDWEVVP
jgi:hypothetical protein